MSQKQHSRSGSHGRKVASASSRPSRPPFLTKRTNSYHHGTANPRSPTQASASLSASASKDTMYRHDESDDESMLQFCATCEKQIITPDAVLYCSEACRKRDASHHDSFSSTMPSPPLTPSTSFLDMPQYSHIDIIPQRSPTVLRPLSMTFSELSLSEHGSFGALDSDYQQRRHHSEASSLAAAAGRRRGQDSRASADSYIPSLSHSPSSSYSSTVASTASYQRPRLPRHNPYASSFTTKSIDLVLPHTLAAASSSSSSTAVSASGLKDASLESSVSTLTSYRIAGA